jgi:hypothetical protein
MALAGPRRREAVPALSLSLPRNGVCRSVRTGIWSAQRIRRASCRVSSQSLIELCGLCKLAFRTDRPRSTVSTHTLPHARTRRTSTSTARFSPRADFAPSQHETPPGLPRTTACLCARARRSLLARRRRVGWRAAAWWLVVRRSVVVGVVVRPVRVAVVVRRALARVRAARRVVRVALRVDSARHGCWTATGMRGAVSLRRSSARAVTSAHVADGARVCQVEVMRAASAVRRLAFASAGSRARWTCSALRLGSAFPP